jgi:hypothetical protein
MSYVFRADRDLGGLGVNPNHPLAQSDPDRQRSPEGGRVDPLEVARTIFAVVALVMWALAAISAIGAAAGCASTSPDRPPALEAALETGIDATNCAIAGGVTCTAATLASCPLPRLDGEWATYGQCLLRVGGACLANAGANCAKAVGATALAALGQVRASLVVDPGSEPDAIVVQRYRECIEAPLFRVNCLTDRQSCERALTFCHADSLGAAQVWPVP